MSHQKHEIKTPSGLTAYHYGPPHEEGPLPSLFYFALSAEDTLYTPPFNQPVDYLSNKRIRIFSFTLPAHGEGFNPKTAVSTWAKEIASGNNILDTFLNQGVDNIQFLIDEGWVSPNHIAAAGLSRGGFIATHLAMREPRISHIVGYAPVTTLAVLSKYEAITDPETVKSLTLDPTLLTDRNIRFYIGNRDVCVSTDDCFHFIRQITEAAFDKGIKSPTAELVISPSIGYLGHGTPKHIFEDGAEFFCSHLL